MESGPKAALEKLRKYCAYQERSNQDVVQKLWELQITPEWHDEIIISLIQENFLNEERFARAFARGKFSIKKWGRVKITDGLKKHGVSKPCIKLALTEIDGDKYFELLNETVRLKRDSLKEKNPWKRKSAIYRFAVQRGFESSLVLEAIEAL